MTPSFESKFDGKFLKASGKSRALLVIFPGLSNDRKEKLQRLAIVLHAILKDVDILILQSFPGGLWVFDPPEKQALANIRAIDEACTATNYQEIRFLSYSMGATIARKVLIGAFGEKANGVPFEEGFAPPADQRTWHKKVSRFVSVVGYARGWFANPRMAPWTRIALNGFGFLGHFLQISQFFRSARPAVPMVFALRRGSPFVFNTRIQWLGLSRSRAWRDQNVSIVHVMSSNDELISSVEVIDVESDDQRKDVHYMTVPNSDHRSVLDMSAGRGTGRTLQRLDYFLSALCGESGGKKPKGAFSAVRVPRLTDRRIAMPVDYLDDTVASRPNENVGHFVFVVHGIRDTGAWAKKIGAELRRQFDARARAKRGTVVLRTDTQSYGYFTAFPFIFPWIRRQKVEWLMDRYATARALCPNATISFVGHSNGTYLAAAALRDYETCTFERVVFAGSVVRTDFDWPALNAKRRRIGRVINYVATSDFVVAIGPKGIKRLFGGFFDLGSAGHDGFEKEGLVKNLRFAVGKHGAGIAEHTWAQTAAFILGGPDPEPQPFDGVRFAKSQKPLTKWLGKCSPFILALIALVTIDMGWSLSEKLLGLPQWSPLQSLLSLPNAFFGDSVLGQWLAGIAGGLNRWWAVYDQWPILAQAACVFIYGWLVRLVLFRL